MEQMKKDFITQLINHGMTEPEAEKIISLFIKEDGKHEEM